MGERGRAGFVVLTAFVVALAAGSVIFARPSQAEPVYAPHPSSTATPRPQATLMPTLAPMAGLVTLGDSITQSGSWPALVNSTRIVLLHNAGMGGDTTAGMVARLSADVLAYRPDVVTVLGGTNDVGGRVLQGTTTANLRAIIEALEAANVKVVLLTIPPRTDPAFAQPIRSLNAAIRDLAGSKGVTLADIYPPLTQDDGTYRPEMTADGVHPSATGNAAIASVVADALRTAGF
jgi:lysophospholipase L1-like esterase